MHYVRRLALSSFRPFPPVPMAPSSSRGLLSLTRVVATLHVMSMAIAGAAREPWRASALEPSSPLFKAAQAAFLLTSHLVPPSIIA